MRAQEGQEGSRRAPGHARASVLVLLKTSRLRSCSWKMLTHFWNHVGDHSLEIFEFLNR